MAVGYIEAQVITSRGAIPVPDATVTVTTNETEGLRLLGIRRTDRAGLCGPIRVFTPEEELSERPEELQNGIESPRPYTSCTIRVAHRLYETLIVEDAQVFANRISRQQAILIPLREFANPIDSAQTVQVPFQNL